MAFIDNCSLLIFRDSTVTYNIVDPFYRRFVSYPIVIGDSSNFIAILADNNAGLNNGKVQVATSSGFFIIDLNKKILYDAYTQTVKGRANEVLTQEGLNTIAIGG